MANGLLAVSSKKIPVDYGDLLKSKLWYSNCMSHTVKIMPRAETLAKIQMPSTVLPRLSKHLWAERFYRLFS